MRYRAVLAYDGTDFRGFQRQAAGIPTIQGELERAIARVTGETVTVIGSGRTDSGVHASGQVIAFDLAGWSRGEALLLKAINAVLVDAVALQSLQYADPGFHPRFGARSRCYAYTIVQAEQRQPLLQRYTWRVWQSLDLGAMNRAAALLIGEHDFATFGQPPQGENTVRTVHRSEWTRSQTPYGSEWVYRVEANAFLQHMVRRIVGMLVEVGRGHWTVEAFEDAFRRADLSQAKVMAPPQGLNLEAVRYLD